MNIDFGMLGKMGTSIAGELTDHSIRKTQYAMDVDAKSYREEMASISRSMQYNNLTTAEAQLSDQSRRATFALEQDRMADKGAAEVAAAAAGVTGGSVQSTMRQLERSSLNANAARTKNYHSALRAADADRKTIDMQAIFNKDVNPIAIPSASDALLGISKSVVEIWDDNQPEGHKVSDSLSRMFDRLKKKD